MSELKEFTKILIFKNTEETRSYFGEPYGVDNIVANGKEFNATYPPENILGSSSWNADSGDSAVLKRNLLHAMGVEESNEDGFGNLPESSGTGIIVNDKFYIGGELYPVTTTYAEPSLPLAVNDYIFYGEDPNNLKIGGKITKVYTAEDVEYADGARYQFFKNIAIPFDEAPLTATITDAESTGTVLLFTTSVNHSFTQGSQVIVTNVGTGYNGTLTIASVTSNTFSVTSTAELDPFTGTGTATSVTTVPVPQDIYYYRNSWNGKGINTDITEGFFILVGVELDTAGTRSIYPWLDPATNGTSSDKIVDKNTGFAFTDLLRVKRISSRFKSDQSSQDEEEIIPCSIARTNTFYYNRSPNSTQRLNSFFTNNQQAPYWVSYFVNPYAGAPTRLDKNTTYVIEISERLPSVVSVPVANNTQLYSWATKGSI